MSDAEDRSTEELAFYSLNQLLGIVLNTAIVILVYANLGLVLAHVL